jgi:hypothetical protein
LPVRQKLYTASDPYSIAPEPSNKVAFHSSVVTGIPNIAAVLSKIEAVLRIDNEGKQKEWGSVSNQEAGNRIPQL